MKTISSVVGKLLLALFGGIATLYLLSGVGQAIDEYILTRPLWQIWIAGLVVGGIVYLIVMAARDELK